MNMNATMADDTLKIIVSFSAIAVIYCLVEMVRYWHRRNTHTSHKISHHPHQHLNEQEYEKSAAVIDYILKHEEALFKQPPPNEECPICFLTLPSMMTGRKYKSCCGKIICSGCIHAVQIMDNDAKCPFCRVPISKSSEVTVRRIMKRVEVDDAYAICDLGLCYYNGERGLPQDRDKALELLHRAGELGSASAYYNIGHAYYRGRGVERDTEKAKHYLELAAIGGHEEARYNLGIFEEKGGNMSIALKHYMIAAGCGYDLSLKKIRKFHLNGHATKDDYAKALQAYQTYVDEIKSDQRDEAAAFNSEKYRYY